MAITGVFFVFYVLLMLGLFGLSIYCMILFIKVTKRGIEALDIYIDNNRNYEE